MDCRRSLAFYRFWKVEWILRAQLKFVISIYKNSHCTSVTLLKEACPLFSHVVYIFEMVLLISLVFLILYLVLPTLVKAPDFLTNLWRSISSPELGFVRWLNVTPSRSYTSLFYVACNLNIKTHDLKHFIVSHISWAIKSGFYIVSQFTNWKYFDMHPYSGI